MASRTLGQSSQRFGKSKAEFLRFFKEPRFSKMDSAQYPRPRKSFAKNYRVMRGQKRETSISTPRRCAFDGRRGGALKRHLGGTRNSFDKSLLEQALRRNRVRVTRHERAERPAPASGSTTFRLVSPFGRRVFEKPRQRCGKAYRSTGELSMTSTISPQNRVAQIDHEVARLTPFAEAERAWQAATPHEEVPILARRLGKSRESPERAN